jgi:hypothetical protein
MTDFTESQSQIIMNELFVPFSSTFVDFEEIIEGVTTFGKIKLNINKFPITKKHLDLEFNIDNSGSMSDRCADGRTKMEHMNFTVENILRYLHEHNVSATISVNSFDDKIIKIIQYQGLNSENIEEFAAQIRKIRPNGSTDIGRVLEMEVIFKQPDNCLSERIFLMFTDGQATAGRINKSDLKKIADKISDKTTIVTVGCGLDHDFQLLSSIADRKNSSYKFIGKLEEAALACGEVLDKILNKILKNVTIIVQNGQIYNWKTNEWTDRIETDNIVAECDKTYNIRSSTPDEFRVTINATTVETDEPFEFSVIDKNMNQDLRKDKYRQRTLELLYEVNIYNKNTSEQTHEKNKEFKNKLKELLKEMKIFMDDNQLRDDLFMKMLCDDIFVSYNTFGTAHGHMYTASRQTSQATQGIHNNTVTVEYNDLLPIPPPLALTRGLTYQIQKMEDEDEDEDEEYDNDEEEEEEEIRYGGAIDACSGIQFCSMPPPPKLKRSNARSVAFIDEDEDIFTSHKTMESDVSPYANIKTLTLMRAVSDTPKNKDKYKDNYKDNDKADDLH